MHVEGVANAVTNKPFLPVIFNGTEGCVLHVSENAVGQSTGGSRNNKNASAGSWHYKI
jgi:hypothetical protein